MLLDEARRLGVQLRLAAEVVDLTFSQDPKVRLSNGETLHADVIIGCDGG